EIGRPFTQSQDQKRGEINLSAPINPNHPVQATYTKVWQKIFRTPFDFDIDPIHDAYNAEQPNDLFAASYNGVLRSNLFVEAQFSRKTFAFVNSGGTSKNIIDSPYIAHSLL